MKTKTTKQTNKAKKNRLLTVGPNYRYAGIIHARVALKAGEHKLQQGRGGLKYTPSRPNSVMLALHLDCAGCFWLSTYNQINNQGNLSR